MVRPYTTKQPDIFSRAAKYKRLLRQQRRPSIALRVEAASIFPESREEEETRLF